MNEREYRFRDRMGNVWYWTGHTWTSDTLALPDVVRESLPESAGPFTRAACD